jgi:polyhydroxyalkanoate synthase subunit PhaC
VENFVRMERWIFDSPDVPGETFRQFAEDCYQKNLLIQNKLVLGEKKVDLKKLTMPLLNFFGEYDHLVPPEACNQLSKAVGSKDAEDVCLETGHIGIYVSSKFQRQFAPKIARWLKERDRDDFMTAESNLQRQVVKKQPRIKRVPDKHKSNASASKKKSPLTQSRPKKKVPGPPKIINRRPSRKDKLLLIQKIAEAI